jgi:hypothetical protein
MKHIKTEYINPKPQPRTITIELTNEELNDLTIGYGMTSRLDREKRANFDSVSIGEPTPLNEKTLYDKLKALSDLKG